MLRPAVSSSSTGPRDDLLVGRTERSLSAAGVALKGPAIRSLDELTQVLADCVAPVVLMRAGAFLAQPGVLAALSPSATGKPLAGFGAVLFEKGECSRWRTVAREWRKLLDSTGGDLDRRGFFRRRLPEPASIYLEPAAAHELSRLLREGRDLAAATAQLTRDRRIRTVHLPALDARASESLRVLQLVTSIQIGGAERVALDLADEPGSAPHSDARLPRLADRRARLFPSRPSFSISLTSKMIPKCAPTRSRRRVANWAPIWFTRISSAPAKRGDQGARPSAGGDAAQYAGSVASRLRGPGGR